MNRHNGPEIVRIIPGIIVVRTFIHTYDLDPKTDFPACDFFFFLRPNLGKIFYGKAMGDPVKVFIYSDDLALFSFGITRYRTKDIP